jgi:hypothetical protein
VSAPTYLELMQYYDDELDAARRAEVEAWLVQADDAAGASMGRGKLAGLEQVSLLVREHTRVATAEVDLVSAIMDGVSKATPLPEVEARTNGAATTSAKASSARPDAEPKRSVEKVAPREVLSAEGGAANDNGRLIFVLAAVAAVAAAAMFYWGRHTPDGPVAAGPGAAGMGAEPPALDAAKTTQAPVASAERADPVASAVLPEGDEEESPGVEVASVDFGKRSGAIYYVAGASQGATTPVVWLSDE